MNVTVYVNGKLVTKEEISKIEIQIESVRRMFAEKIKKTESKCI